MVVRGNQTKEWEQSAFSSCRSAPLLGCGESQADCLAALIICWTGGTVSPWWRAMARRSPLAGCPSLPAPTWPPPQPQHGNSGHWALLWTRGCGPESCAEWPVPGSPWAQTSLSCAPPLRDIKKMKIRWCRCKWKNLNSSSTHPSRRLSSGGWWRGSLYELTATALDEQLRFVDETPRSCTHTNKRKQKKSVNITLGLKRANTFVTTQFESTYNNVKPSMCAF